MGLGNLVSGPRSVQSNLIMHVQWQVRINGKRSLNGKVYGVRFHVICEGDVPHDELYDTVHCILDTAQENNREMEIVEAIQVTLTPVRTQTPYQG